MQLGRGFMINDATLKCVSGKYISLFLNNCDVRPAQPRSSWWLMWGTAGLVSFQGWKKRAAGRASSENVSEMDSRWLWFVHRLFGTCWAWLGLCTPPDLAPVLASPSAGLLKPAGCESVLMQPVQLPPREQESNWSLSKEIMPFRPKKNLHKTLNQDLLHVTFRTWNTTS